MYARLANSWEDNPLQTVIGIFSRRDPLGNETESFPDQECRHKDYFLLEYQWLIKNHPEVALKNLLNIPFYGSWKDLVKLAQLEPSVLGPVANLFAVALDLDLACLHENERAEKERREKERKEKGLLESNVMYPSLSLTTAAKYTPRKGVLAREIASRVTYLGPIPPYRFGEYLRKRFLVPLRKALDILEVKKCAREWEKIEYSKVPKIAAGLCHLQFFKHDHQRYAEWLISQRETPPSSAPKNMLQRYERISL